MWEKGDFQGCVVMNYLDKDVFYVCSIEFKYFILWEIYIDIIVYYEYFCECGVMDELMYFI